MTTATSIHFQQQIWTNAEKTPIRIVVLPAYRVCVSCHRRVQPERIVTAFLSRPLDRCPLCNSKIQYLETK